MRRFFTQVTTLLALAIAALSPVTAPAQLISHWEVPGTVISPDGDGLLDSLIVNFTLSDTAYGASAFVFTTGSPPSVVDTLLFDVPFTGGTHTFSWHGTDMNGIVVPDGSYDLLLRAFNAALDESVSKTVHVDVTPPVVTITSLVPGIFAPDIDTSNKVLVAGFTVSDSPPEDGDQIQIFINGPAGTKLATLESEPPFAGNGPYEARWDGTGIATDGWHEIRIRVTDGGGHLGTDWSGINVDKKDPTIHITGPESGGSFRIVPDSLSGWAWDRNGINADSLLVSYTDNSFTPVTAKYLSADTLFFGVPLAAMILEEGQHVVLIKGRDVVGRTAQVSFRLTYDTTAPVAPTLAQPPAPSVRTPAFTLEGTAPGNPEVVLIYRNSALIDSIDSFSEGAFEQDVPLLAGTNAFTAVSRDEAGNTSALSNTVQIVFDAAAGLFMPQPFRADEAFQINLTREARAIELRLYDMAGDLIRVLQESASSTSITIPWDGLNGNSETVERGPIVVVARIEYADGGTETFRKIVLLL